MTDKYRHDCLWFGVYEISKGSKTLVAVHRSRLPVAHVFELSQYIDISPLLKNTNKPAELNRLAVKEGYRKGDAARILLAFELVFLAKIGVTGYIGSASSAVLLRLFRKAGFKKTSLSEFKFDTSDHQYSFVVYHPDLNECDLVEGLSSFRPKPVGLLFHIERYEQSALFKQWNPYLNAS